MGLQWIPRWSQGFHGGPIDVTWGGNHRKVQREVQGGVQERSKGPELVQQGVQGMVRWFWYFKGVGWFKGNKRSVEKGFFSEKAIWDGFFEGI